MGMRTVVPYPYPTHCHPYLLEQFGFVLNARKQTFTMVPPPRLLGKNAKRKEYPKSIEIWLNVISTSF
jgi:hypothetical protein